jgi:4-aminobutyrate aminotransferase/(S)-3-amino-2-methylpropionate transaminase
VSSPFEQLPPLLRTPVPGPRSRALAERLAEVESRNVTCSEPVPPVFWERASGCNVWDVDGNRYVDLTAGFGVANAGHAHPRVVGAVQDQAERLLHALGDVHPADVKVALLEALARRFPGGGPARAVLGSSGSDAVEAALKTALVATGRPGVVAFEGAYHGLALGALDATFRPFFREPFAARLPGATRFARYGAAADALRAARRPGPAVGAVLVEPIQGRGGERIPPPGFLRELRELCDGEGWLLVADEVYTGFGRTGRWFACEHEGVVPDLLCVGKGLAAGMPLSACVGRAEVMDRWPPSRGESLHTQTFLGHPPGCAAALASLAVLEEEKLVERAAETGARALAHLRARLAGAPGILDVRGRGLLLGIECDAPARAARACAGALARGVIALGAGDDGRVVSITPPLGIDPELLESSLDALAQALA